MKIYLNKNLYFSYKKPLIIRLTERIKLAKIPIDIVWCTSKNKDDDKLEALAKLNKISLFRGDELNVLSRFLSVIKLRKADGIVRITGDNPLTDHWQVDITSDGGENWSALEYTNVSQDAWVQRNFLLSNSGVQLTEQVQFRFIAEDISNPGDSGAGGSIIEAAIDDFTVSIFNTNPDLSGDLNGDGLLNVLDVVVMVNLVLASDCPDGADMNADGSCNVLDVVILVNLILG